MTSFFSYTNANICITHNPHQDVLTEQGSANYRLQAKSGTQPSFLQPGNCPDSPVVKTQCFHCRDLGSVSAQETKILQVIRCSPKQ